MRPYLFIAAAASIASVWACSHSADAMELRPYLGQIEAINRQENDHRYVPCATWPQPTGGACYDCMDFVLAKRDRLIALGLPAGALRVAQVLDERNEPHAVLEIVGEVDDRPKVIILDNRFVDTQSVDDLTTYHYLWLAVHGGAQ